MDTDMAAVKAEKIRGERGQENGFRFLLYFILKPNRCACDKRILLMLK